MKIIISGIYVDRLIRQQTRIIPPPQNGALGFEVSSTELIYDDGKAGINYTCLPYWSEYPIE